ncbi:MAG: hypothetical protein IJ228_03690 [Succinivibrio sp.]|nr:hypothetical protein [Succinivibrio sp.]
MRPEEFLPDEVESPEDDARQLAQMLAEEAERTYRTDMQACWQEGFQEGFQKTFQQSFLQSFQEGLEIGRKKGLEEYRKESILKMYEAQISKDDISEITGYDRARIEEIIRNSQLKDTTVSVS